MQQIKLLTLLALLGHLSLDPSSPSPAVASAANNRRFTDYSDPSAARSSQPQDASGASDPSAWIRSAGAQDFTSRRRGSSLLPGFPSAGSGADPFSTWNQYMYEMVRNMMPFGGGMDASSWFAGEDEDAGTAGADGGGGSGKSAIMRLPPGVHARETEAERLFFMDLPGFHRSEVTVEVVAGHLLSIRAERKCDPSDAYCTSRSIKHKLELDPDTIDTRKISVNLDAGELRIHLPKRSATRFSIPVIDSLFGLNQPGASDTAGDKVKIAKIKSDDQPAEGLAGAIHWPGMPETAPGIVGTVKEWYESAKDTAGNVVESAESVAQRAKQAAFGSAEHVASEGGRAVQDAANYARRAVHHTTDTAQDALGRTAQGARENVEYAANVAGQARDTAYGAAQDAASQARGAAQGAASQARGSAQHVANQVRGTAEQAQAQAHDASNYASNLANQVRDTAYGKAQEAAESMYGAYGSAADSLNQAAGAASDASLRAAQAASETAAKARDAAADTAASAYDSAAAGVQHAKRAAGDAAESVQAKAGDAVDAAKDTATSLKQAVERNVVEPVESAAEAAAHKAGEALDATRHKAGEVVDGARHKAGSWFGFFQDVGAGAKEAAVEGSEGVKEGWEKGTTESRIKRQAAGK